jgi:hypothetical protein
MAEIVEPLVRKAGALEGPLEGLGHVPRVEGSPASAPAPAADDQPGNWWSLGVLTASVGT